MSICDESGNCVATQHNFWYKFRNFTWRGVALSRRNQCWPYFCVNSRRMWSKLRRPYAIFGTKFEFLLGRGYSKYSWRVGSTAEPMLTTACISRQFATNVEISLTLHNFWYKFRIFTEQHSLCRICSTAEPMLSAWPHIQMWRQSASTWHC